MPHMEMDVDDRELRRVIAAGRKLGPFATTRLRQVAEGVGLKLLGRAMPKVPVGETGILQGSGDTETVASGGGLLTTVTFGGMAAKYAEVQHENPNYTHTREAYAAKYGLTAGARSSLKTRRTSYRNASGGALKLKGHHGGQSHWLYGGDGSAYDGWFETWMHGVHDRALTQVAREVLGG